MPDPDTLPFVAPCRKLSADAPFRWLARGWRDLTRTPLQSLTFGIGLVLLSYALTYLAYRLGSYILVLALLSGFVFVAPVIVIGLYETSRELSRGRRPSWLHGLRRARRVAGNAMVFALVLLILFLVWARAASMIHVFFPVETHPQLGQLALFLGIGSVVGSLFAAVTFSASAFSLPMIADRRVDTVTAVITSINAVLRNKRAMAVWAMLIVLTVGIGFATALLGLSVAIPLIGYATWHAYVETIDASAWPLAD